MNKSELESLCETTMRIAKEALRRDGCVPPAFYYARPGGKLLKLEAEFNNAKEKSLVSDLAMFCAHAVKAEAALFVGETWFKQADEESMRAIKGTLERDPDAQEGILVTGESPEMRMSKMAIFAKINKHYSFKPTSTSFECSGRFSFLLRQRATRDAHTASLELVGSRLKRESVITIDDLFGIMSSAARYVAAKKKENEDGK